MSLLSIQGLTTKFDDRVIHDQISFDLEPGTITALIGASGCGKSTLLRVVLGLLRPTAGRVELFGKNVWESSDEELAHIRQRYGVLFQNGALFSGLTVGENVAAPIQEQTEIPEELVADLVHLRLALAGLPEDTCQKMPSELSGGMRKRVGLARALALEPELLFLDEPTSGLDPINARSFDALIRSLRDNLRISVVMVTHDLDSILGVVDRVLVLESGRVLADGSPAEVSVLKQPWIRDYFSSRV